MKAISILLTFVLAASAVAQTSNEPRSTWRYGLSCHRYQLLADDDGAIIFPPQRNTTFGFHLSGAWQIDKHLEWLWDSNAGLGEVDRGYLPQPGSRPAFSLDTFVGVQYCIINDWLKVHGMTGVGYLYIGGFDGYDVPGGNNFQYFYYGNDPGEMAYVHWANSLKSNPRVVPGVDSFTRFALAANLGVSVDLSHRISLSFDYVPLFAGVVHDDFRIVCDVYRW